MCSWTLPCASSLAPSVLHLSHGFQCSPTLNRQPYEGMLLLTSWWRKSSNTTVGLSSRISLTRWFLQLTSRKPLWLDLQPVDIKSRWRHNWKSAQVVNSHLVCDHTVQVLTSLGNSGLYWTVFTRNRDTAVPAEGNGDLQTDTNLSDLWRDPYDVPYCQILSPDKTEWRPISATLRMNTLFHGWPVTFHVMHRRRRLENRDVPVR